MRLEGYLTEAKEFDKLIPTIEKECSDIIAMYKKTGKFLYRGVKEKGNVLVKHGRSEEKRKPVDTPAMVHKMLNVLFTEKFGWAVRNGVPVTTRTGQAMYYGIPYIFLPVNGYQYVYSKKIRDLYADKIRSFVYQEKPNKEWVEKHKRSITAMVNKYTDTGLENSIDAIHGELFFKTDKYYLVNLDKFENSGRNKWKVR